MLIYDSERVLGKVYCNNLSYDIVESNAMLCVVLKVVSISKKSEENSLEFYACDKEHLTNMLKEKEIFDLLNCGRWVFMKRYSWFKARRKELVDIMKLFIQYDIEFTYCVGLERKE